MKSDPIHHSSFDLQTFFEKFDQFADAPDAVAKMRELILELAVQGRLVPQDSNDEPAEVLCEPDDEVAAASSFEVPHGWIWTHLARLAEINGGFAFKSTAYTEEGTRVIRISDFDEFGFKDHKVVRHPFSADLQKFSLEEQNILMAMTGGTVGKSYFVRTMPEPMIVNQRVATIKVLDSALPSYIDIVIRSEMTQEVIRKAKNSTNDNISMGDIKGFTIPLPPLAEQRRIVAKVDELMALCDRLEEQQQERETQKAALARAALARFADAPTASNLELLFYPSSPCLRATVRKNETVSHRGTETQSPSSPSSFILQPSALRKTILTLAVQGKLVPQDPNDEPADSILRATQSLFQRMVAAKKLSSPKPLPPIEDDEVPFSLPIGWAWFRLGQVMRISSGDGLIAKDMNDGPFPVYGGNGVNGYHDEHNVAKRTLLIGRVGFYCGSIHVTPEKAWVTDNAFITTFDEEHVDMDFLSWLLKATDLRERDNATAQPVISGGKVYPTILALPPLAEQRRIVAKVEQLMALVDELEAQLAASHAVGEKLLAALVAELTTTKVTHSA